MAIATGLKSLADEIVASYEERQRNMSKLREDNRAAHDRGRDMLSGMATCRAEETARLRQELARERTGRASETRRLTAGAREMLSAANASRIESAVALSSRLAELTSSRRSAVNGILSGAEQALRASAASRRSMGESLRAELSGGVSDIRARTRALAEESRKMVDGSARSRREMHAALGAVLARSRSDRLLDLRRRREQSGRARSELKADLEASAAAWKSISRIKTDSPGGMRAAESIPDLEARLLAAVAGTTGGISLAEIAAGMGVAPVVLGRAVRSLLESGKLRKENRLYFAAAD